MANEINVNVMMFGGTRCGKTSVIAAMQKCFENVFSGRTNILIRPADAHTRQEVINKTNEIEGQFTEAKKNGDGFFSMDGAGTSTSQLKEHKLKISVKGKESSLSLNMIDYPGEWLKSANVGTAIYASHQEILQKRMASSNIMIIAIDTPYLMEETNSSSNVGAYNDGRNHSKALGYMLPDYFVQKKDSPFPKMIIFVPLKCERYYNRGKMEIVKGRIKQAYKEVFDFVKGNNLGKYEVVISPILTLGENTAEFSRFHRDPETLDIVIDGDTGVPKYAEYMLTPNCRDYNPKLCEMPLIYALAYMLKYYKYRKANASFLEKIVGILDEVFGNLPSLKDFSAEEQKIYNAIRERLKDNEIVDDPLHLVS